MSERVSVNEFLEELKEYERQELGRDLPYNHTSGYWNVFFYHLSCMGFKIVRK